MSVQALMNFLRTMNYLVTFIHCSRDGFVSDYLIARKLFDNNNGNGKSLLPDDGFKTIRSPMRLENKY